MKDVLIFFNRFNGLVLFVSLEIIALYFVVRYNTYQRAAALNSAGVVAGTLFHATNEVRDYARLHHLNDSLSAENARLMAELGRTQQILLEQYTDSLCYDSLNVFDALDEIDPNGSYEYAYISAKIINKTTTHYNNYMTIDKGRRDGIAPEMGVVSSNGVVGVVKDVSERYALVIPILNQSLRISAKLRSNNLVGAVRWTGNDIHTAVLDDIPKHFVVGLGDTVLTSGYSSFFPPNLIIGTTDIWTLPEGRNAYEIKINLSADFETLNYVYVINYLNRDEQKALEKASQDE